MKNPIVPWLLGYRPEWLRADVVGGLTASAVVVPKAMAIAVIAGLPVQAGLYTALAAMVVYPLLGTSRPLSVTSTSSLGMLTSAEIVSVTAAHAGVGAGTVAVTLAFLVGAFLIAARVFRLGFLANYFSKPVLIGFEAGVGVAILVSQLKSVLGVHFTSHSTIGILLELPSQLAHAHGLTMLVAAMGLIVLIGLPRLTRRLPAALVWVAISIASSAALGLAGLGVHSVGAPPPGLPALTLLDVSLVASLWPGALGLALMSFTESVATARTFRQPDDPPVVTNRELLATGAANIAAAFVGGLPAGGGASQTNVAEEASVRSQAAQWVGAAAVLAILLFAGPLVGLLPQAALGALIVVAGFSMIKPSTFRTILAVRPMEFVWALVTTAGIVLIGTLEGILIAVAVSVLTLLYQANHPPVYAVVYNRRTDSFGRAGEDPEDETLPGLLVLRTEGRLTFANVAGARDKMHALADEAQPRVIVLECSAIPDIEYTALLTLTEAERSLAAQGVELWLAGLNPDLAKVIARSALGSARTFADLRKALDAWRPREQQADVPA